MSDLPSITETLSNRGTSKLPTPHSKATLAEAPLKITRAPSSQIYIRKGSNRWDTSWIFGTNILRGRKLRQRPCSRGKGSKWCRKSRWCRRNLGLRPRHHPSTSRTTGSTWKSSSNSRRSKWAKSSWKNSNWRRKTWRHWTSTITRTPNSP